MNSFKEDLKKEEFKYRFKKMPVNNFIEECPQSHLQRKYEWFKKKYAKVN